MFNQIDGKLAQARATVRRKQKLESMLAETRRLLQEECSKLADCERTLEREQADVDKLEGFSLTGMFYSVLGTKAEHLKRERQELLAAKLIHDEGVEAVGDARTEIERFESELSTLAGAQAEYDRLIQEKERLLERSNDPRLATLASLAEQSAELQAERKELEEAVQAGEEAGTALERVSNELRSAENWGTWDLLGGGFFSTMVKHSHIDSARAEVHHAQQLLHRFTAELADADQRLQVSLDDIGGFSKFADYFFDGLIADWVVQSKIKNASSACLAANRQVSDAIDACRQRLTQIADEWEQISKQRRQLIEQA